VSFRDGGNVGSGLVDIRRARGVGSSWGSSESTFRERGVGISGSSSDDADEYLLGEGRGIPLDIERLFTGECASSAEGNLPLVWPSRLDGEGAELFSVGTF